MTTQTQRRLYNPGWFVMSVATLGGAGFIASNMIYGAAVRHQQASECVAYYQAQNMSQQAIDAKCGIRRR